MKILRLHIENFGCFSQQDYDFQNGLNSVLEQNGYGKSTMATFIAVMFYGFYDEKGRAKDIRKQYKPWQGGNFGGTIDFEYQNKGYRISRTFGTKPGDDEMHVYDLETRLVTDELTENPGVFLFQVDGDSFLRTVFIRDNDCHVELTDGVHSKIGGLVDDAMDLNSFQAADEKLKNAVNALSPTRSTGEVKKLREQTAALNLEISAKGEVERAVDSLRTEITRLREEKKEKQEQLSTVNQKQEVLAKYQTNLKDRTQYEDLYKAAEERRRSFDEATRKFPAEVPDKEELAAARTSYNEFLKYEELKNTNQLTETEKKEKEEASSYFGKSELFSDDELSVKEILTDIHKAKEDLETEKKDKEAIEIAMKQSATAIGQRLLAQKKARMITLIAGVVLIAFSVLGISLQWFTEWKLGPVFSYALLGVGAVLFIIGLILLFTKKNETISEKDLPEYQTYLKNEGRIAELTKDISDGQTKLVDFFDRFGVTYENKDALLLLNQIAQAKKDLARLKEKEGLFGQYADKATTEKGKATGFVSKYGFSSERPLPDVLSRMESLFDDYEDTKREHLRAAKNLSEFHASHDVAKYTEITAPSFLETMEELNTTATGLSTKISDITEKILAYDREIDDREVKLRDLTEKEEERDEKLAKADELAEKHRLLTIAQSFLTSAKQALTARYQNPVEEHLRAYMAQMTENSGPEFTMDANGELKLQTHGDLKAVESLSHGYRDLAGFALRLSLIDAMYQDEKPPVILDDPFVNLDAEKLEKAKDVVQTLAESYQVLYFTCHESRNI